MTVSQSTSLLRPEAVIFRNRHGVKEKNLWPYQDMLIRNKKNVSLLSMQLLLFFSSVINRFFQV